MSEGFIGADVEQLRNISDAVNAHADQVDLVERESSYRINRIANIWSGPGATAFQQEWVGLHAPRLRLAAEHLKEASQTLRANADQQAAASAVLESSGVVSVNGRLPGRPGGLIGEAWDFLVGDAFNYLAGRDGALPVGQIASALLRLNRVRQGVLPLFNTGLVGRNLATLLLKGSGPLQTAGLWLQSPAASTFFRTAGILGGVASTAIGAYGLYQQGNPVDAFKREGAGYVADVAGTAFSASMTAFLIAPTPVTGALALGTGAVWVTAEVTDFVVDRWGDEIGQFASDAWDAGTGFASDAWDAGTGFVDTLVPDWF